MKEEEEDRRIHQGTRSPITEYNSPRKCCLCKNREEGRQGYKFKYYGCQNRERSCRQLTTCGNPSPCQCYQSYSISTRGHETSKTPEPTSCPSAIRLRKSRPQTNQGHTKDEQLPLQGTVPLLPSPSSPPPPPAQCVCVTVTVREVRLVRLVCFCRACLPWTEEEFGVCNQA